MGKDLHPQNYSISYGYAAMPANAQYLSVIAGIELMLLCYYCSSKKMIVYGLTVIMLLVVCLVTPPLGWDLCIFLFCLAFPDYPGPLSFFVLDTEQFETKTSHYLLMKLHH